MFSITVFFEMMFAQVMPRQLAGGHTHLYTNSSMEWIEREFELEPIAIWWFGTDMVDLYRSVRVELEKDANCSMATHVWDEMFSPVIDKLQLALDKERLSSEVHVLYRLRND